MYICVCIVLHPLSGAFINGHYIILSSLSPVDSADIVVAVRRGGEVVAARIPLQQVGQLGALRQQLDFGAVLGDGVLVETGGIVVGIVRPPDDIVHRVVVGDVAGADGVGARVRARQVGQRLGELRQEDGRGAAADVHGHRGLLAGRVVLALHLDAPRVRWGPRIAQDAALPVPDLLGRAVLVEYPAGGDVLGDDGLVEPGAGVDRGECPAVDRGCEVLGGVGHVDDELEP